MENKPEKLPPKVQGLINVTERKLKHAGGRPIKRKIDVEIAMELGRQGLTRREIAKYYGVAPSTLYRYFERFPQVLKAVEQGEQDSNLKVLNALYNLAIKGNVTAQIFWLKNKMAWHDGVRPTFKDENKTETKASWDKVISAFKDGGVEQRLEIKLNEKRFVTARSNVSGVPKEARFVRQHGMATGETLPETGGCLQVGSEEQRDLGSERAQLREDSSGG